MEQSNKQLGGSVYEIILDYIVKNGIVDVVTGDIYIARSALRERVLGIRCRFPAYRQVRIIQELITLELIVEQKGIPNCVLIYNNAEVFYKVPVEVVKRFQS